MRERACGLLCGRGLPAIHNVGGIHICDRCWELAQAIAADARAADPDEAPRRNGYARPRDAGGVRPEPIANRLSVAQMDCTVTGCDGVIEITTDGNGRLIEIPCPRCRIRMLANTATATGRSTNKRTLPAAPRCMPGCVR